MFTGIVETTGVIEDIAQQGTNKSFWIKTSLLNELKIDQSISHDGVCLTVEEMKEDMYKVTAIEETLNKTNINVWKKGDEVNLERCMQMNGRLDGHIVQGHVDTTAVCVNKIDKNGSWQYTFSFDEQFASLIIEKGSVCVNGTSLTAFEVMDSKFSVAIIPYTYNHTNIKAVETNSVVNIEFDMVGKYITRYLQITSKSV